MSWKTINQILGIAMTDPIFWQEFQHNPLRIIQQHGFELTDEEKKTLCTASREDLAAFCQYLIGRLGIPEL
jgi:hypothetical protein